MKAKAAALWEAVHSSYWFIPSMMTAGAIGLSVATTALDVRMSDDLVRIVGRVFSGGPEDARQLISMLAGSMITVAGVTFSVTIVALTLASQQFGPRLLHNFMRDTGNQVVLGTFVATFVYCLMVFRSLRVTDKTEFVPQVSATVAIGLALASLGVLIFFIHHVAASIRVTNIIAAVSRELKSSIDRLFPRELGQEPEVDEKELIRQIPEHFDDRAASVSAAESGYIQAVDTEDLMALAEKYDLLVRLNRRPGHFVVECGKLADVWPAEALTKEVADQIRATIIFGAERTPVQDVEFSINQLVEMAVRALSPGINDPATAVLCVDQLGVALCHLSKKEIPSCYRTGKNGKLRVIARPIYFSRIISAAFDQIRQYGRTSVPVTIRLLETIAVVAEQVSRDDYRTELKRHAAMILEEIRDTIPGASDRQDIARRHEKAMKLLGS